MTGTLRMRAVAGIMGCAMSVLAYGQTAPLPSYAFTKAAVVAGARIFASHCSACHAVSSLRYQRLSGDLGLTPAFIKKEIMLPSGAHYLQGMHPVMTEAQAIKWFGMAPPNLSHVVRAQGAGWIYRYLTSFYWDPKRPSGWNNHVFPQVAMPDVLAPWGGTYAKDGRMISPGREPKATYQRQVADVVAFLRYASDPSIFERRALGRYVLGTLILLSIVSYLLKKEYWKDVKPNGDEASQKPRDRAGTKKS